MLNFTPCSVCSPWASLPSPLSSLGMSSRGRSFFSAMWWRLLLFRRRLLPGHPYAKWRAVRFHRGGKVDAEDLGIRLGVIPGREIEPNFELTALGVFVVSLPG